MSAITPETLYDRIVAAVDGVSGIGGDGLVLENEQTADTLRDRTFRVIPQGRQNAEGWGRSTTHKYVEERITVRLSHLLKPLDQDASRAAAYTDALAVEKAIETDATLRSGCPRIVVSIEGPAATEAGDHIHTDIVGAYVYLLAVT